MAHATFRAPLVLYLCAVLPITAAVGDVPPATTGDVSELITKLGLHVAAQPVRERPGWRAPHVVLVSPDLHGLLPQLQGAAPHVKLVDAGSASARDIAAADASIGVCTPEVLAQAKQLQWIQWPAAGVERCVQQPPVRARHLLLTNLQRTMGPSMAEHVVAMMLALSRHFDFFAHAQQQGNWVDEQRVPQLEDVEGKTVLVVGLGGIGTEVARRAHALGMKVTATRASGKEGPDFVSYVGLPDELGKLAREADYVVNCAPLTAQTTGIFNREFFAALKRGTYFISVGRGRSTVTADLIAALKDGQLGGAGLDVVDPEPLPADSPLWHLPNVIITPHISANTQVAEQVRNAILVENLRRYAAGEPMVSVVDVERGY